MIVINFIEYCKDHIKVREATKQGYAIGVGGDSVNLEQPNSKTRRGRIGHQVAQTLTCSCNQGVIINNEEKNMKEFTNSELVKYNFNMDKIRVFDVFAGIGALHQSLKELGVPTKITNISEIDVDAIISYAGVHIENFINLDFEYPSDEKMREWLIDKNIGWDFKKQKSLIPRLKKYKLNKVYKASMLLNNLGDISKIDYDNMEDFDLFNFSFPCTDISNAGQQKGLKNEDGTPTRSGLVVYGLKAIRSKKPKFIMIENVKGLIQKKFIDDFYDIIKELEDIGYKCYYPTKEDKKKGQVPTCLNAKDYGIPQNRERIYVICVRSDVELNMTFPKGFDNGIRLKDVLEDKVDEKYYLGDVKNFFINNSFTMESNGNGFRFEPHVDGKAQLSKTITTRAGARMDDNFIMDNTLHTDKEKFKFDSNNEEITKDINLYSLNIRKLTPKECWRLMGFRDECFEKARELGVSDSQLYKQAGNSIVVNVLYYIFKELFKDYIIR